MQINVDSKYIAHPIYINTVNAIKLAKKLFDLSNYDDYNVTISIVPWIKNKGTIGMCSTSRKNKTVTLTFSQKYYDSNEDVFLDSTVLHEVSHMVVHFTAPMSKPHGVQWKNVMRRMGVRNEYIRAKSSSYTNIQRPNDISVIFDCKCQYQTSMTTRKYKNLVKNMAHGHKYICSNCKDTITVVKLVDK